MKPSMQPKTLEDYKDLTKVLKLKIVKQSKIIQELQAKCKKYEDDMNNGTFRMTSREQINLNMTKGNEQSTEDELSSLKGKSRIMQKFLRSTNTFGISPQSIYRIADIFYTNCIESDYFRTILSKISLSLSPKQISSLIFIFDENCSGYISKQDYDNSLHAYEVSCQQRALPYLQVCLLKLCGLIHGERVDLNKFYDQMKAQAKTRYGNGAVDLGVFEAIVKKYFTGKLQERQIVGAFNQINLQKQKSIEKKNFLYGITSFTNRLLTQERASKIQNASMNTQQQLTMQSNLKNSRSILKVPGIQNQSSTIQKNVTSASFYQLQQVGIQKILKQKKLNFEEFTVSFAQLPIKSRMTIHQFKKCFKNFKESFSLEDIAAIFRQLDIKHEGSIQIFDVINYCLLKKKDPAIVFRLLGKTFEIYQMTPDELWASEEYEDFNRDISKSKFIQIMGRSCETPDPQTWDIVWGYFDKGKGSVSVQSIIDVMKKFSTK